MPYSPTTWTNDSGEPIDAVNLNKMEGGIETAQAGAEAAQAKADLASPTLTTTEKTSSTGATILPVGTTAQRPSPTNGHIRYNSDLLALERYSEGAWGGIGGADDATVLHNDSTDETKSGSLTIGENISIISVSNDTANITLTVASHNSKVGDTIYVSGLNLGNGTHAVTLVTATTIVYASTALATTVSSAFVKYGELKSLGGIGILGHGQTNYDMLTPTILRAVGVTYTNNEDTPIQIGVSSSDVGEIKLVVTDTSGNAVTIFDPTNWVTGSMQYAIWTIPVGFEYIITTQNGSIAYWVELRKERV